jgi:hypothetical protein
MVLQLHDLVDDGCVLVESRNSIYSIYSIPQHAGINANERLVKHLAEYGCLQSRPFHPCVTTNHTFSLVVDDFGIK